MRGVLWWVDRWRQSEAFAAMTAEEQGLYRNLCDELWIREDHVIPDDERQLAKASGDHEAWARCRDKVLRWMKRVPCGWTNETALEVIGSSKKRAKKQKDYRDRRQAGSGNAPGNAAGSPFTGSGEGTGEGADSEKTDSGAPRPSRLEALADEVVACWNTRRDRKADAKRSASHVALVDKLDKAKYSREEVLLVALVAAHHEPGKWYREHSGNEGLLIALGLGGRPRNKDGVVASLTKNHFAALLEAPPLEYGPQMAVLLEAKGLTEAARERGWKLRAA